MNIVSMRFPVVADFGKIGTVAFDQVTIELEFSTNRNMVRAKGYMIDPFKNVNAMIGNDPLVVIKKIIANGPATIIFWVDGTKTIVKYRKVGKSKNDRYVAIVWAIAKKLAGSRNQLENYIRRNSKVIDKKSANENDIVALLLMGWLSKTPYELKKLIEDLVDKKLEVHE